MIPIVREALPDGLDVRLAALTKELATVPVDDRKKAARQLWEKSSTRTQVHRPLQLMLRAMALGLEQCMYCGTDFGTDIDHFEPKARNPAAHFRLAQSPARLLNLQQQPEAGRVPHRCRRPATADRS